jgi:hypothetical protein
MVKALIFPISVGVSVPALRSKQAHSQQPLDPRNAPSDRGLIDPKFSRRGSNTAGARQGENVTQIVPIQVLHLCSLIQQSCQSSSIFSWIIIPEAGRPCPAEYNYLQQG